MCKICIAIVDNKSYVSPYGLVKYNDNGALEQLKRYLPYAIIHSAIEKERERQAVSGQTRLF